MSVPNMPNFGPLPPGTRIPQIGVRKQNMEKHVQGAMAQLSLAIYTRLVTRDHAITGDEDWCRTRAKLAQTAARCYFEGIGVIEKEKEECPES